MKKRLLISMLFLSLFVGLNAQELANFSRGAGVSPEIGDETVTFRISAPQAKLVRLSGSWMAANASVNMMKDDAGLWSVSIRKPAPELYTYNFIIDGLSVTDANNIFMQRDGTRYLSVLLVPGDVTENYFEANKRGNLEKVWYNSPTIGMDRRMYVYTPYGYATSGESYPVLYLLHGGGGDEDAWSNMGRACQILDNLIEKGLAVPMICVMPNGNATQAGARTTMIADKAIDRNNPAAANMYVTSLVKDIIPYIEKNYRVVADADHRAVAGLSMGGGHTTAVTQLFPGTFNYICPLSSGMRESSDSEQQLQRVKDGGYKLYWIGCGSDDALAYQNSLALDKMLNKLGMQHTLYITDGGHTWANWRKYLNTFGQLLFK